jgi:hypothetical protein
LTVVASQELGQIGTAKSAAVPFSWRWYYHTPSLPVWGLLLAMLILVRGNHSWQAWLILLPPLLVMLVWRMFARLVSLPPSAAEPMGNIFVALAGAWGVVWLLGHWLAARHGAIAFLSGLAVMLVVGAVSFLFAHGVGSAEDLVIWAVFYCIGSIALLAAMTLSGWLCRKEYRPGRFMAWLLLWAVVLPTVCLPIFAVVTALVESGGIVEFAGYLLAMLIASLVGGLVGGAMVFALNLPFMFLAIRCPLYRDRFCDVFRMSASPIVPSGVGM